MTIESTIAGSWYPGTEREIRAIAEKWEKRVGGEKSMPALPDKPNALLMPHAGWAYSGEIAWRAARLVRGMKYNRVVVLAPSHRAWIENRLVAPEAESVSTPLGKIVIDKEWLDRLALMAPVARNNRIHAAEHSAQIEYPLLQLALGTGFTIVPLVMGSFGRDQMAMCARALARLMDDKTLLVISSDFTHYGTDFSYAPYGTSGGEDGRQSADTSRSNSPCARFPGNRRSLVWLMRRRPTPKETSRASCATRPQLDALNGPAREGRFLMPKRGRTFSASPVVQWKVRLKAFPIPVPHSQFPILQLTRRWAHS